MERQAEGKREDVKTAARQAEEAARALEKAKENKPEADRLQRIVDKIAEEQEKYQHRDDLMTEVSRLKKAEEGFAGEAQVLKEREEALKEKIQALRETIMRLKDSPEKLALVRAAEEKYRELQKAINAVIDVGIPELEERRKTLESRQKVYIKASEAYQKASHERLEAERILDDCRAGILAAGLREGQKCPVCGSVHHPELAKIPDTAVSEESFKKLKEREEKLQTDKSKANTAAETAKSELELYRKQVQKEILNCLENSLVEVDEGFEGMDELIRRIREAKTFAEEKIRENTKRQRDLEKDSKTLLTAEKALEDARGKETETLAKDKDEFVRRKQETERVRAEKEAVLKTLSALSFDSWETADSERKKAEKEKKSILNLIELSEVAAKKADEKLASERSALETLENTLEKERKEEERRRQALEDAVYKNNFNSVEDMLGLVLTEKEIAEADKKINSYRQEVTTNRAQMEEARKDAEGRQWVDAALLKEKCGIQLNEVTKKRNALNVVQNRLQGNEDKLEKITSQEAELARARKEYNICARLYNLVKGTTGNGKITLEQYIQAAGFDGIIAAANKRLLPMSDGQYELYRQEDSLGKKSNTFLDLEVLDNFTGHRRPVGNLSGGESFKASLSLALGLSDKVSQNQGGIQMDALFVDEGFGTLDRKSIDSAMDILVNLSGKGKLVGIISHREELMENIPQQIRVKKTKDGSEVSIITGV